MINEATLLGRVGKKDTKTTKSGKSITYLSIATSRKYNDSEGNTQNQTTWHNVNCFSKVGEIADKYLNVGDLVWIRGEMSNKKIESGERAGQYYFSINANELKLLPNAKKESDTDAQDKFLNEMNDDIPF